MRRFASEARQLNPGLRTVGVENVDAPTCAIQILNPGFRTVARRWKRRNPDLRNPNSEPQISDKSI